MIVKPDVPLTPTDASYSNMAHGTDTPQIASTWSDFGELRTNYVFAFTQGKNAQVKFSPSDFGMNAPVYVYDYFAGTGQLMNSCGRDSETDLRRRALSGAGAGGTLGYRHRGRYGPVRHHGQETRG